ncbi:MAG: lactate racemase domain-containing protein [Candidatus Hadarchaeum sp.]|uniref:lactate racemase domain-containing protein n=1 Tax=Candidatus Hadarchaeum sp. TaxID=2883567 RepID=UPI003171E7E5
MSGEFHRPEFININFSVGGGYKVKVKIPRQNLVVNPRRRYHPCVPNLKEVLEPALVASIQSLLSKKRRRAPTVAVLVPDSTRQDPVNETLKILLSCLTRFRISPQRVCVVIATGTHTFGTPVIDEDISNKISTVKHNCRDQTQLVFLGNVRMPDLDKSARIPVWVNKMVWKANYVIGIGSVRPHRAVGYSGGSKIILPGISGEATIGMWHWLGWEYPREVVHNKICNPMRNVMDKVAEMIGLDIVINYVLNREGLPRTVVVGSPYIVWKEAAQGAAEEYTNPMCKRTDILILGCKASATTLYEAAAQLQGVLHLLKQGGTAILLADCPNRVAPGYPEVARFGYVTPSEVRSLVAAGKLKSLLAASHIMYISEAISLGRYECIVVSRHLKENILKKLGFKYAPTPEEALNYAFRKHGTEASIQLMPHGIDF